MRAIETEGDRGQQPGPRIDPEQRSQLRADLRGRAAIVGRQDRCDIVEIVTRARSGELECNRIQTAGQVVAVLLDVGAGLRGQAAKQRLHALVAQVGRERGLEAREQRSILQEAHAQLTKARVPATLGRLHEREVTLELWIVAVTESAQRVPATKPDAL